MKATGFMESLHSASLHDDCSNYANILPDEYFDTPVGKKVISFLSKEATIVDEKSFTLTSDIIRHLHKKSIYQGRSFFSDMKMLGFSCECISYHQEEAPIRTYLFKVQ